MCILLSSIENKISLYRNCLVPLLRHRTCPHALSSCLPALSSCLLALSSVSLFFAIIPPLCHHRRPLLCHRRVPQFSSIIVFPSRLSRPGRRLRLSDISVSLCSVIVFCHPCPFSLSLFPCSVIVLPCRLASCPRVLSSCAHHGPCPAVQVTRQLGQKCQSRQSLLCHRVSPPALSSCPLIGPC